jgi:outer membrane receptor protein involved in Fe transport
VLTGRSVSWFSKGWFLFLIGSALCVSPSSRGQVAGGTILGTVRDTTSGGVANVAVTVTDIATGVEHTVTTNSAGYYSVPNLVPAIYEIHAKGNGFADAVVRDVKVTVGAQQEVNITLELGKNTQTIRVEGTAIQVDLTTSTLSAETDGISIRELPLNGRDWAQLATLQPGVNEVRNQSAVGGVSTGDVVRALRGFGNQLSISGARPQQNNYRLDGVSINDYTNGAPGGVLGALSGVDAIQEFSILTTNYSAEYGRTSGGVINAITRSGSNEFHGSLYEFLRNSALDARNFFDDPTQPTPPFKRNQFGGTIGGPLVKDKTFWFFNYEGLRQSLSSTQTDVVPTKNARNGTLGPVDSNVAPYLAFWPFPNQQGVQPTDLTGLYKVQLLQRGTENLYTARVDHKFSDKDSLTATFGYDNTRLTQPDALNNVLFLDKNLRPFGTIEETHIFSSSLVNSLRFGFNRNDAGSTEAGAANPLAAQTSFGFVPGRPSGSISVPGITSFLGGVGAFPNFTFGWNSFQGYDDAFLTRGNHSLKFGFAVERMQSNNLLNFSDNGGYVFGSLPDFLANTPQFFFSTVPGTATPRGIRETLFGGYVQDDWKVRSNLTLNLGVRYETVTAPAEVQGKLAVLRSETSTAVHTGDPYFHNPTLRNFEPRIGFAWDPFKTGKTALRGGFGFYDVLPLPYQFVILSSASAPFAANVSTGNLKTGAFPAEGLPTALAGYESGSLTGQRVSYIDPNPKRSYVLQWNLNVQRELAKDVTATVGYVGSRGIHLPYRTDDSNITLPTTLTSAGYVWPFPTATHPDPFPTLNPGVGQLDRLVFGADSYYHALQAGLKVNVTQKLLLQSSFTYGKSIDTGSSTIAGDQFANSPSSVPFWFDARTRRAVSDFNLGKNFVLSGTYQLPDPTHWEGAKGWAFRNWQLGGILEASSGAPFTVIVGGDLLGLNSTDPWNYPSRIAGPGCSSLVNSGNPNQYVKVQCFAPAFAPSLTFYNANCNPVFAYPTCANLFGNNGRNALTGPGLVNTDFSLAKNTKVPWIWEGANLQFRAELFNIFNHPNFAAPNENNVLFGPGATPGTVSPVGTAGQIVRTQTTSRQVQFGLKLTF